MNLRRIGLLIGVLLLVAVGTVWGEPAETARRSAYSYIRDLSGEVTVESRWNGTVEGRRNMPITSGDEIVTGERGRAEVSLADGSVLHIAGGTRVRFVRLRDQQGEDDEFSAVDLKSGSIVLGAAKSDEGITPRIDTDAATVYLAQGARVRVNADSRRGTVVVARNGSAEVRTRAGSYTVKAGSFLSVEGEEEPEIARGSFSRDRFDIWSADRFDVSPDAYSAATRFVDEGYEGDVASMEGNGDWSYNATYASNVWSPRVAPGWTPYSNGCWYYTPAGLTWLPSETWGWYPSHYGSWFYDTGWNRWCWNPGGIYSPAWVYWGFSGNYVGWAPVGWVAGFYSPWWDNYYRRSHNVVGRGNMYFAVHGTFSTRQVDMRGWNFTGATSIGAAQGRLDVIPGSRIGDRLGSSVAITSHTIVVPTRDGGAREAVQNYVREAPRVIDRTANPDSSRMAPVLSRQRDLPPGTSEAMRDRVIVPVRGRPEGVGADSHWRDTATPAPDRGRAVTEPSVREAPARGRTIEPAQPRSDRRPDTVAPADDWRTRGRAPAASELAPAAVRQPSSDWRSPHRATCRRRGASSREPCPVGARKPEATRQLRRRDSIGRATSEAPRPGCLRASARPRRATRLAPGRHRLRRRLASSGRRLRPRASPPRRRTSLRRRHNRRRPCRMSRSPRRADPHLSEKRNYEMMTVASARLAWPVAHRYAARAETAASSSLSLTSAAPAGRSRPWARSIS